MSATPNAETVRDRLARLLPGVLVATQTRVPSMCGIGLWLTLDEAAALADRLEQADREPVIDMEAAERVILDRLRKDAPMSWPERAVIAARISSDLDDLFAGRGGASDG